MGLASGPRLRLSLAAIAWFCALLAFAQAASAASYCVYETSPEQCPASGTTNFPDLQTAFGAASANPTESHTVDVRPGEHDLGPTGATYAGVQPVDVVGAGPTTRFTYSGTGTAIQFSTTDASFSDAALAIPAGTVGIDFAGDGAVTDLALGQTGDALGQTIGVRGAAAITLQRSTVSLEDADSIAVSGVTPLNPDPDVLVEDSTLTAGENALYSDAHPVTVRRSTLSGGDTVLVDGATLAADNSVLVKTAAGGAPVRLSNAPTATLVNATIVDATGNPGDPAITVHTSGTTSIGTEATLLSGYARMVDPVTGGGQANADSRFDERFEFPAPDFVNAGAGNYRLRADSGLIDRALAAAPSTTDRDGKPRTVNVYDNADSRPRDIGAYEFEPHAPTVTVTASRSRPARGQNVTFTAAAADPDPGDDLVVLWSFDGRPAASGGTTQTRAFNSSGPHTATVTVVDRTRRTSAASVTVVVPAPPSPKPEPEPQPEGPKPGVCINSFNGTTRADRISGSVFGDAMIGNAGNDVLRGLAGDDCLLGDEGSDKLYGGDGGDLLRGHSGNDLLEGGAGNDNLSGGSGRDRLVGSDGNDRLGGGTGKDRLKGGRGRDSLTGGGGRDSFAAGPGNDKLNTRDRKREKVDCGAGRDSVTADRIDKLRGCERKKRR